MLIATSVPTKVKGRKPELAEKRKGRSVKFDDEYICTAKYGNIAQSFAYVDDDTPGVSSDVMGLGFGTKLLLVMG